MRRYVLPMLTPVKATLVPNPNNALLKHLNFVVYSTHVLFRDGDRVLLHQWTKEERPFVDAFLRRPSSRTNPA